MLQLRFVFFAAVAALFTLAIFYFMFTLIAPANARPAPEQPLPNIYFSDVEIPGDPPTKPRTPPPKPPQKKPPPQTPKPLMPEQKQVRPPIMDIDLPTFKVADYDGSSFGPSSHPGIKANQEGDIIPLIVVQPNYPQEAMINGIEGWVMIEFTITPAGAVSKPRVINAQPARVFDREAIRAILKWKFKPRIIDGKAVHRQATQMIDFSLGDV